MKQLIKTVQQIGNGGHIYVPKELVGQKVLITPIAKSLKDIEKDILEILQPHLKHIMGIYIYGSYARNEQTSKSDIDILVITNGKIKIEKKIGEYEITSATMQQIQNTIKNNVVLILPIIKESIPILNSELIEILKNGKITKKNTKWYIETTESSLKLAKEWLEDKNKESIPHIVYPLVMRLRGLYLIESLILNKKYSIKEFLQFLVNNGMDHSKVSELYRMYREHRYNKPLSQHSINHEDIERLHELVNNYFLKIKTQWEKLR